MTAQVVSDELRKVKIIDSHDTKDDETSTSTPAPAQGAEANKMDESMFKSALESQQHEDLDRQSSTSSDNAGVIDHEEYYGDEVNESGSGPQWTWLTLGTCKLDPSHLPSPWFIEHVPSQINMSGEAWRTNILQVSTYTVQWEK